MKRLGKLAYVGIVFGIAVLSAGCSSFSLLTSDHVHYHGVEDVDGKIGALEKRVEALEKGEVHTPTVEHQD